MLISEEAHISKTSQESPIAPRDIGEDRAHKGAQVGRNPSIHVAPLIRNPCVLQKDENKNNNNWVVFKSCISEALKLLFYGGVICYEFY